LKTKDRVIGLFWALREIKLREVNDAFEIYRNLSKFELLSRKNIKQELAAVMKPIYNRSCYPLRSFMRHYFVFEIFLLSKFQVIVLFENILRDFITSKKFNIQSLEFYRGVVRTCSGQTTRRTWTQNSCL